MADQTHQTRVSVASRAGTVLGYRALCACGWGWERPLHTTRDLARQAGDCHVIAECDHPAGVEPATAKSDDKESSA